jgi:signal transduction histidine kinase
MCGGAVHTVHTGSASSSMQIVLRPAGIIVAAFVYAALVLRRKYAMPTVALVTIGAVVTMAVGSTVVYTAPAIVIALFHLARYGERNYVIAVGFGVMVALTIGDVVFNTGPWQNPDLAVVPWVALAIAAGQGTQHKSAYLAELEERARRAERARDEEARRRVDAERLRIARELHDVIGHHVALINVQAGAAEFMLDTEPDHARRSLAHIRKASQAALEELRITVGLLRQPGDREPTEPAPGLGRLDELIGSFASAGLPVKREVDGDARPLPEAVDLTVYRVVQESLTNTSKHAGASVAMVRLAYKSTELRLMVEDDGRTMPGPLGEGHGIIGMLERVAAVGGTLTVGPCAEGGFRVAAVLPIPAATR